MSYTKKENFLLLLGFISYLTIVLVPVFSIITRFSFKNIEPNFYEKVKFIEKTSFINFLLFLAMMTTFWVIQFFPKFPILDLIIFTVFVTTYLYNFFSGTYNWITKADYIQI